MCLDKGVSFVGPDSRICSSQFEKFWRNLHLQIEQAQQTGRKQLNCFSLDSLGTCLLFVCWCSCGRWGFGPSADHLGVFFRVGLYMAVGVWSEGILYPYHTDHAQSHLTSDSLWIVALPYIWIYFAVECKYGMEVHVSRLPCCCSKERQVWLVHGAGWLLWSLERSDL